MFRGSLKGQRSHVGCHAPAGVHGVVCSNELLRLSIFGLTTRPAQHVHRRRNNGKGRIPSALASAHGRNGKRRVETFSAGRAGAHRPSEALHPTRSSDVLLGSRGARPYAPHVAKRVENGPRRTAPTAYFERNDVTIICETVHQGFFAEIFLYARAAAPIQDHSSN